MIRDTSFHCRGNAKRLVHPTKIIPREMQAHSCFQVRQLLAESIGQAGEPPELHSHGQVLALNEAGRDVLGIGIALSNLGYNPRDAWWGVPRFGRIELPVVAKHLRELGEVYVRPKALRDAHGVVIEAIRSELHAVCDALIQVPEESPRI